MRHLGMGTSNEPETPLSCGRHDITVDSNSASYFYLAHVQQEILDLAWPADSGRCGGASTS